MFWQPGRDSRWFLSKKKLKNHNVTRDPLHPPSWKIPLEISILFFGIPPQGQVPPTLHFQAIYISSWTLKLTWVSGCCRQGGTLGEADGHDGWLMTKLRRREWAVLGDCSSVAEDRDEELKPQGRRVIKPKIIHLTIRKGLSLKAGHNEFMKQNLTNA